MPSHQKTDCQFVTSEPQPHEPPKSLVVLTQQLGSEEKPNFNLLIEGHAQILSTKYINWIMQSSLTHFLTMLFF